VITEAAEALLTRLNARLGHARSGGEVIPLVTKAFCRDRGEPRGSSVAIASSPTGVNLLQQTPLDKVLGDVLASNSRALRLIEFKQLALY
jgi:hypothetical protein